MGSCLVIEWALSKLNSWASKILSGAGCNCYFPTSTLDVSFDGHLEDTLIEYHFLSSPLALFGKSNFVPKQNRKTTQPNVIFQVHPEKKYPNTVVNIQSTFSLIDLEILSHIFSLCSAVASQGNWIKQKGKAIDRHLKVQHSEVCRIAIVDNFYSQVCSTVLAALYRELFLFSQRRKQRKKYLSYKMSNCFPDLFQFPTTSRRVSEKTISFCTNQVCIQLFIFKKCSQGLHHQRNIQGDFQAICLQCFVNQIFSYSMLGFFFPLNLCKSNKPQFNLCRKNVESWIHFIHFLGIRYWCSIEDQLKKK